MAHIPMDDTDVLWQETSEKSWKALRKTLEQHRGKTNGIENELVSLMMDEAQKMEIENKPYPESPQELNQVLNENLPQ
jgi:hypothetical protein